MLFPLLELKNSASTTLFRSLELTNPQYRAEHRNSKSLLGAGVAVVVNASELATNHPPRPPALPVYLAPLCYCIKLVMSYLRVEL